MARKYCAYLRKRNLKKLAGFIYWRTFRKRLNWKNPQNLNEKINWLKFYSDTSLWTQLADKYLVRQYVEKKGLGHTLPQLYGVWENAAAIDFDTLPKQYVLKTNHGCGTNIIVKDAKHVNRKEVVEALNDFLKIKFGRETAEPHYQDIKPLIICEEFLNPKDGVLNDYKLFMADGKLELILVVSDRTKESYKLSTYDANWNYVPDRLAGIHTQDNVSPIHKPASLDQMVKAAEILSEGFPQVRVDFYDIDGKLYFGEMTFTSQGGYMSYLSKEELLRIGARVTLPNHK